MDEQNYDYSEVYQRLPVHTYLAYGMGHILNDVCASMWFTYLLVFMHLVLDFTNTQAGALLLVGQIADALSTPFVGYYSDQGDDFWICRYGKRKSWHLVGTICVILTFPFIFLPCVDCENDSKWSKMFYYSMFIIIFQFGWAAVQISHLSLIPEISPNTHDRTKLTSVRYAFTVLANVVVYVITWTVLHLSGNDDDKINFTYADKFGKIVIGVMSFGTICSIMFHVFVKENGINNSEFQDVRGTRIRTTDFKQLFSDIQLYQVALNYMGSRLFINLTQVFLTLYLHECLDMVASSLAIVPLVMYISNLITSVAINSINKTFGRKITYVLGTITGLSACVFIYFGKGTLYTNYLIYVVASLLGSASSIILVSSLGITTDLIGTRTNSSAFVFGVMSFVDKLSNGIAVIIIQGLHGNNEPWFYKDILTYVCGGAVLIGGVTVIFLKKPSSADEMTQDLFCDNGEASVSS